MASRDLADLIPDMQARAVQVQAICEGAGIDLLIHGTLRSLDAQAVLYRQSRSRAEIAAKMHRLEQLGFGFLARVLERVGPQSGPHRTNAAPGESFHNYGLAFDAVPMLGGKCCWKYGDHRALWQGYGEAVRQAGLDWAGDWTRFREYPHAQLGAGGNPLRRYSPDTIAEMLAARGLLAEGE